MAILSSTRDCHILRKMIHLEVCKVQMSSVGKAGTYYVQKSYQKGSSE